MPVIDSSIVGPMALPDEPPLPAPVAAELALGPLLAPAHWPLEVVNMLHMAERRHRIDRPSRQAALHMVQALNVDVHADTGALAWTETSRLADLHGLTIYDAAYLELAVRLREPLATRDADLAHAARAENLRVLS